MGAVKALCCTDTPMAFSTAVFFRSTRRRVTILVAIVCLLALAGLWVTSRRVAQNSPDRTDTSSVVKKRKPIHTATVLADPDVAEILVAGTDSQTSSTTPHKAVKHTFVHIPKTGGSALEKIVGETIDDPSGFMKPHHRRGQRCSRRHIPPSWFEESTSPYAGTQSFTVLRNPYARLISEYRFMCWGPRKTAVMKKILKKDDLGTVVECKRNYAQMNEYINAVLPTANKDPEIASLTDCHFIPQAEYAKGVDHVLCSAAEVQHYVKQNLLAKLHQDPAKFREQKLYEDTAAQFNGRVLAKINKEYAEDFKLCGWAMLSPP